MSQCWACRASFSQDSITRDGIISGRTQDIGGPYRIYTCPSCRKKNRIEKLANGANYCSPAKKIALVEWLFGWIEPLAPEDFLEIQRWHHQYGEERQAVFEATGDQRYSRSLWGRIARWFKPIWPRASADDDTSNAARQDAAHQDGARGSHPPAPSRPSLPHPYRLLGLPSDATDHQIRDRFKQLVRANHPDKLPHADPDQIEAASRRLQELIQAFEELQKKGAV
ncbi:MAG: J domain-containing protein [Planctomycetota bacterium]|nr:J domain-containing protein [Planctomycetota bacterium]